MSRQRKKESSDSVINCRLYCGLIWLFLVVMGPINAAVAIAEDAPPVVSGGGAEHAVEADDPFADDEDWMDEQVGGVIDPFEPLNRICFVFNDKLYFWVMKPMALGYGFIMPKPLRLGVRNFFNNLMFPIRFVNNSLQGKFRRSGVEAGRFFVNTTIGVLGFTDPASNRFGLETADEDFGQTLGHYGLGGMFYICWPVLGPSNVRDSVGLAGDYVLNPLAHLTWADREAGVAAVSTMRINQASLAIGDYEDFVGHSFDPYVAVRDAYYQHRKGKIEE